MNDKKQFIEKNIDLVYFVVNKYYPSFSKDEDIVQCGMVGLCNAVEKWEKKGKFSSYATKCILNEIRRELKDRAKRKVEISLESLLEGNKNED